MVAIGKIQNFVFIGWRQ